MLESSFVRRLGGALLCATLVCLWSGVGRAEIEKVGDWPETSPMISLSLSRASRSEALRKLADAAHWNVIYRGPEGAPIDLHVKQLPPEDVMEALFADASYRAERKGDLITIVPTSLAAKPEARPEQATPGDEVGAPSAAASADALEPKSKGPSVAKADAEPPSITPPTPPAVPSAPEISLSKGAAFGDGKDRVITGSSITIQKDEVVHDLTVMGGSAEVHGTVTGDLTVMGGRATLHPGARVGGDAAVVGGNLELKDDTEVGGDVGVMGGKLTQAKGARVLGEVQTNRSGGVYDGDHEERGGKTMGLIEEIGSALTKSALLFVFGVVLMALATRRMDALSQEVTLRPMRSFAMGVVGWLAALLAFIVLCVTVIGIPIALLGVLVLVFVSYAGICAVLQTLGGTLVQHRTKNPYTHLAVGCAVFLLVGAIPWLGGFFTFAVMTMGLGAAIASRKLGLRTRPTPA